MDCVKRSQLSWYSLTQSLG
jgi:hypothetical protein